MTKRTIEIDDDLDDMVENVKEEIKQSFIDYLKENKGNAKFEDYYQDRGCDDVHEIADSSTPVYYSDIDGLYYLYGNEFDEAYENAGIGNYKGWEDNHRQVAIYCYLSEKGFDYLRELESLFDDTDNIETLIKELEE